MPTPPRRRLEGGLSALCVGLLIWRFGPVVHAPGYAAVDDAGIGVMVAFFGALDVVRGSYRMARRPRAVARR